MARVYGYTENEMSGGKASPFPRLLLIQFLFLPLSFYIHSCTRCRSTGHRRKNALHPFPRDIPLVPDGSPTAICLEMIVFPGAAMKSADDDEPGGSLCRSAGPSPASSRRFREFMSRLVILVGKQWPFRTNEGGGPLPARK